MKLLILVLSFFCHFVEARSLREALLDGNAAYLADLMKTPPVSSQTAIAKSFNRVRAVYGLDAVLYVARAPGGAMALQTAMVVDASLELAAEVQRCFIIAHEFAHIKLNHYELRLQVLSTLAPGNVDDAEVRAKTQWVFLQPEARAQAWRMELEADESAVLTLKQLGYTKEDILLAFQGFEITPATPTHPSTTQRFINLRRVLEQ